MLAGLCREHGQDLIEYVIIMPILAVGDRHPGTRNDRFLIQHDRRRCAGGMGYGVIHPTNTAGINTATRADNRVESGAVDGHFRSLPGGNVVRVEVTYNLHLITSLIAGVFGQPTMRLRAVTTMQIE